MLNHRSPQLLLCLTLTALDLSRGSSAPYSSFPHASLIPTNASGINIDIYSLYNLRG